MLSRAGMDTAEALAGRFDIDLTSPAFWRASLDVVRARVDEYVDLAAAVSQPN